MVSSFRYACCRSRSADDVSGYLLVSVVLPIRVVGTVFGAFLPTT